MDIIYDKIYKVLYKTLKFEYYRGDTTLSAGVYTFYFENIQFTISSRFNEVYEFNINNKKIIVYEFEDFRKVITEIQNFKNSKMNRRIRYNKILGII
jgi:hypothetical protein